MAVSTVPELVPSRQGRAVASNEQSALEFLTWKTVERGISSNTTEAYGVDLGQFCDFLGSKRLATVTRRDIRAYIDDLLTANKPSSIRRKIAAIRGLFTFLLAENRISQDPTEDVELPKPSKRIPRHLEPDEIDKILPLSLTSGDGELSLRDRAILEFLYGAGVRASEVVNAKTADIDLVSGFIIVRGKGDKERKTALRGRSAEAVKRYLLQRSNRDCPWLFADLNGNQLTRQRVWQIVGKCSAIVGRHVHPHMFRHSCATHMVQNGAGIRDVQILMGHAWVETTEIYTHIHPDWVLKNYAQFHPRASGKCRQMPLQLDLEPLLHKGLAICSHCPKPAFNDTTYCREHLQLNRVASQRSHAKKVASRLSAAEVQHA